MHTVYPYKKVFLLGVLSSFVLMGVNAVADFFHIYSGYHWFDIPMHFFGGFSIGLLSIGVLRAWFGDDRYGKTPQLLYTLLFVLAVGVIWEVLEFYFNVSVMYGGNFWFDTIKDLLLDTLGGILSYICFHPHIKKQ